MAAVLCFKRPKALCRQLLEHRLQPAQNAGKQPLPAHWLGRLPPLLLLPLLALLLLLAAAACCTRSMPSCCSRCRFNECIHARGGLAVGQVQPDLRGSMGACCGCCACLPPVVP